MMIRPTAFSCTGLSHALLTLGLSASIAAAGTPTVAAAGTPTVAAAGTPTVASVVASEAAKAASNDGSGWTLIELDLDIRVLPGEGRLEMDGSARMRLDQHATSVGPHLLLNMATTDDGDPVMTFLDADCPGAKVTMPEELRAGIMDQVHIRFDPPKERGDEITTSFSAISRGVASQFIVHQDVAIASWTNGWHPFTNPTPNPKFIFSAGTLYAPGKTRLYLPKGWIGVVDGSLLERSQSDEGTTELWETPDGIARGFTAGPYTATTKHVGGRDVHIYMRSTGKPIGPDRLAGLIADSMAAQEKHFGPFPFESYSVVETPSQIPGQTWAAASQQTFILAKSGNFDFDHGNLPLWAHEMCHGWWGNTVGSRGPGGKWVSESLAQLGALISIESLEGTEALQHFLGYSREGYGPLQCAAGYFTLLRQGQDQPLAKIGQGGATHDLADSKGVWVYHMLRRMLGDELFFEVLRNILAEFAGGSISVNDVRRHFIEAAPDRDLYTFFSQWLDRTGAPILDVDWYAALDGSWVSVQITQTQDGEPFVLDLEVEIELADGQRVIEVVSLDAATNTAIIDTAERPVAVLLDPNYKALIWRPEYGPRPSDEYVGGEVAPHELIASILGTYRIRGLEKDVRVFLRDGDLYVQSNEMPAVRLLYQEGGVFLLDVPRMRLVADFDLSDNPVTVMKAIENGKSRFADRVDD